MQSFMLDAIPKVWREQNPTTYAYLPAPPMEFMAYFMVYV